MKFRDMFVAMTILIAGAPYSASAFQIAPLSSKWEETLTKETTSTRARVAGKLGQLIKAPVHEEITQLAFGCPTEDKDLPADMQCATADAGFANHFINYGVRWNDLPPFMLRPSEGKRCMKSFGLGGPACNVSQTVRFSTQPECWVCMFKAAEKIAASKRKIVGCLPPVRAKGSRMVTAHLLARSHFGDLQFLHSMAQEEEMDPAVTRADILGWLEFAWKVAMREIPHDTLLRAVNIPVMQQRFGCSGWSVSDLYILGRKDKLLEYIDDIAFGSVLHTVQDSFAEGHVERERAEPGAMCSATVPFPRPGNIKEFHGYASQDGHLHDAKDLREAMSGPVGGTVSDAVRASRQLARFYRGNATWAQIEPYMQCLFTLSSESRRSSAGDQFRRK
jgi:hypothetical protein